MEFACSIKSSNSSVLSLTSPLSTYTLSMMTADHVIVVVVVVVPGGERTRRVIFTLLLGEKTMDNVIYTSICILTGLAFWAC